MLPKLVPNFKTSNFKKKLKFPNLMTHRWPFFLPLIFGILISLSSNNIILMWVGMEINMLSFIPIMCNSLSFNSSINMMTYYLANSTASLIIIMFFCSPFFFIIFPLALMIKIGMMPIFVWLPIIISNLSWINSMVLMTIQKISPMFIIISFSNISMFIIFFCFMTIFLSSINGYNQTQIRPLLAFSSMGHASWIIITKIMFYSFSLIYFLIYLFMILPIFTIFMKKKKSTPTFSSFPFLSNFLIIILFCSLGGIPPLIGFFPKWMVVELLIFNYPLLISFMILSMFINISFYCSFSFLSVCSMPEKKYNYPLIMFSSLSILSLPFLL